MRREIVTHIIEKIYELTNDHCLRRLLREILCFKKMSRLDVRLYWNDIIDSEKDQFEEAKRNLCKHYMPYIVVFSYQFHLKHKLIGLNDLICEGNVVLVELIQEIRDTRLLAFRFDKTLRSRIYYRYNELFNEYNLICIPESYIKIKNYLLEQQKKFYSFFYDEVSIGFIIEDYIITKWGDLFQYYYNSEYNILWKESNENDEKRYDLLQTFIKVLDIDEIELFEDEYDFMGFQLPFIVDDVKNILISSLNQRELYVMKSFYYEEKSIKDISLELQLTETRIWQIKERAIKKLRNIPAIFYF